MKKIIILLIIINLNNLCNAQNFKGCWLPEKYVVSLVEKQVDNLKATLMPLEGIVISKELIKVQTYCSEVNPIKYLKKVRNGKLGYQLLNLHYLINMKCNEKELVEKYKKSKIYIFMEGEKIILEIVNFETTERVYFINHYRKYIFKDIKSSREFLRTKSASSKT